MQANSTAAQYLERWRSWREVFGWGNHQPYWGLLVWSDEWIQATTPWIENPASLPFPRSRHILRALTAGWVATRDIRYAQAAQVALETDLFTHGEWIRSRPSLDEGVFIQNWLNNLGWLMDAANFDETRGEALLNGIAGYVAHLAGRICPASMNWRVADAANLLKAGILLAHHPAAEAWRALAARILNDAVWRQFHPDGSHTEHNPHYHVWMTREMTDLWRISRRAPELSLRIPPDTVARMWKYALFCNRPNGTENGLHDSRGWFSGSRPDAEQTDRARFLQEAGLPVEWPAPQGWFPDAGQALLRDTWQPDAVYLSFDASRWGEGHCHYSRNSIQLHAFGRTLLADPGVFEYADSPLGRYGRSTRAHSTLTLNGWNQAQTDPSRTFFRQAEGYNCIRSDYEGTYHPGCASMVAAGDLGRGIWASHHRCLLWTHGRAIVVIDSFVRIPDVDETPSTAPTLESNWQLGPGPIDWRESERRLVTLHTDANLLMLFPTFPAETSLRIFEGESNPLRGWVSELYAEGGEDVPNRGHPIASPMLTLTLSPMREARSEFITILVPFPGSKAPDLRASGTPATLKQPGCLTLNWPDGSMDNYHWTYRLDVGLGEHDVWETDGSLIQITRDRSGREKGVAWDATYLKPFSPQIREEPGAITFTI